MNRKLVLPAVFVIGLLAFTSGYPLSAIIFNRENIRVIYHQRFDGGVVADGFNKVIYVNELANISDLESCSIEFLFSSHNSTIKEIYIQKEGLILLDYKQNLNSNLISFVWQRIIWRFELFNLTIVMNDVAEIDLEIVMRVTNLKFLPTVEFFIIFLQVFGSILIGVGLREIIRDYVSKGKKENETKNKSKAK